MSQGSRAIFGWEAWGAVFIVVAGSALHFLYGWLGGWRPVALVAPVNESVWEHLKLGFWPGLAWALLPPRGFALPVRERLAGKGFGLLVTALLIVAIFKGYTAVLGRNLLVLDIGTFVAAVLAGQLVAALAGNRIASSPAIRAFGLALLLVQFIAFSSLSFFPPEHWLFIDGNTGHSGVR